jgi:hypothetical protein
VSGPRPGDFGLARGVGLAMAAVRLGTLSRYGHAAVCVGVEHGNPVVIEAMPNGARRREVTDPGEFLWSALPLSEVERRLVVDRAERCEGLPYDWLAILGFVLRFWWRRATTQSRDHPDGKVICSELVAWAYQPTLFDMTNGKAAPGDLSPGDLLYWQLNWHLEHAGEFPVAGVPDFRPRLRRPRDPRR